MLRRASSLRDSPSLSRKARDVLETSAGDASPRLPRAVGWADNSPRAVVSRLAVSSSGGFGLDAAAGLGLRGLASPFDKFDRLHLNGARMGWVCSLSVVCACAVASTGYSVCGSARLREPPALRLCGHARQELVAWRLREGRHNKHMDVFARAACAFVRGATHQTDGATRWTLI